MVCKCVFTLTSTKHKSLDCQYSLQSLCNCVTQGELRQIKGLLYLFLEKKKKNVKFTSTRRMTQCARATTTITTTQRNKTVGLNFLFFFSADGQ